MIHHLPIAARNPQQIGEVFAERIEGVCIPFSPNPFSHMSFARDGHGNPLEIYPADCVMRPNGEAGADFATTGEARAEAVRPNSQLSLDAAVCEINHSGVPHFLAFCRHRRGVDR